MNLAEVMLSLSNRLATISGLRCHSFPPPTLSPPAAVVSYPETITFDETYGRGMDRMSLSVVVVVGKVSDRAARDLLGLYTVGSGAKSIKSVLESGVYTGVFDVVTVKSIDFDVVSIAGVDYMAALFTLDIVGKGS